MGSALRRVVPWRFHERRPRPLSFDPRSGGGRRLRGVDHGRMPSQLRPPGGLRRGGSGQGGAAVTGRADHLRGGLRGPPAGGVVLGPPVLRARCRRGGRRRRGGVPLRRDPATSRRFRGRERSRGRRHRDRPASRLRRHRRQQVDGSGGLGRARRADHRSQRCVGGVEP